jgi:dipeptidyl aminopeptidase/acylaminoacyl peptidase
LARIQPFHFPFRFIQLDRPEATVKTLLALCFAVLAAVSPAQAADPSIYGHLPAVEDMRLAPSGQRYAFAGVLGGKRMLVVATAENKALYATEIGDAKLRTIQWASDDHLLVLLTKTENMQVMFGKTYEFATVMRINVKTKVMTRIFEGVPSVAQRVFGMFGTANADGKVYGYFGGITLMTQTGNRAGYVYGGGGVDLYRIDLDTGKAWVEAQATRDTYSQWVVAPDGKVVGTEFYDPKSGLWRVHAGEGRNKALLQKIMPIQKMSLRGAGRTPGTLLVVDESGDRDRVIEIKADGKTEELFADDSISEYLFDQTTGLLIGAKLNDRPHAVFFDPALDARWKSLVKTFPGVRLSLQSVSRSLDRMIVKSEGGQDSGTYWLAEPAIGKTTPLGQSYPGIRPPQVGSTQMVQYSAEDGLKIEAVLTLPPASTGKNLPLVVLPHGGPIGISDEVRFDWLAQAFAGNGYAVLQPNYRGSSGYGAEFREAGYGEWGKKMLSDIKDGVKAMAERGVIDPKRACIVGASYGGYAALAGVTMQQGLYRCAVSVSGVSDVHSFFRWQMERSGHNEELARFRRAATGSDKLGDSVMDQISPINFVKQADAPILMIHGKDDTVVPIAQSGMMESALQTANKPVEFIRMDGEDHWLSRESTRTAMITAALAFVQKHNPVDQPATAN